MPIVKLPDGTLVQLPEEKPGVIDQLKSAGNAALTGLTDLLRGAGLNWAGMLEGAAAFNSTERPSFSKKGVGPSPDPGQEISHDIRKALPVPENEGTGRKLTRYALEGAGGALSMPLGGMSPRVLFSTGASGAAAGEAGSLTADALKDQNPIVRQVASVLAALGAGGVTAWATGPRDSRPTNVKAEEDSKILRDLALERIGPETDPLAVANKTADAANSYIRGLEKQASRNFGEQIAGVTVPARQVADIYLQLRTKAANAVSKAEADALLEVADQLVNKNGRQFITDLPELSKQLKRLKDNPPGPNASTGRVFGANDLSSAIKLAETELGKVAPEFTAANQVFAQSQKSVLDPTREGPIGRIADRNPQTAAPTPVGRLENLTRDRDAAGIGTTLQQLEQSGAPVRDIARTLVGRSVNAGPVRPGKSAMGAPGSGQEAQVSALLESAGVDPTRVQGPLRAADALADSLEVPTNVTEYVSVHPKGVSLRGIFRPDRWFDGPSNAAEYKRQIAELLSRANPQEMDQLYRLSMFDPKVRSLITAAAAAPQIYKEGEK